MYVGIIKTYGHMIIWREVKIKKIFIYIEIKMPCKKLKKYFKIKCLVKNYILPLYIYIYIY